MARRSEPEQIGRQIKVDASQSQAVMDYYVEVCSKVNVLEQNLAPYVEAADKAADAIDNINSELVALEERRATLLQQQAEYEGIVQDSDTTYNTILAAHAEGIKDCNKKLFNLVSVVPGCDILKDEAIDWDVDLAYLPVFNLIFITEILKPTSTNIAPDEGVSNWMNNINKE